MGIYSREMYNEDMAAIDGVDSLASAAVAGENNISRSLPLVAGIGQVLESLYSDYERKYMFGCLQAVLSGNNISGFDLQKHANACERLRRHCKGLLLRTVSQLQEKDMKRKRSTPLEKVQIKLRGTEFRAAVGYDRSVSRELQKPA